MTSSNKYFQDRNGCPFCRQTSKDILTEIDYQHTAEANHSLPDMHGKLFVCADCGVAYPSHFYTVKAFPILYQKTFEDLKFFDESFMQRMRKSYIKTILRNRYKPFSFARFLDWLSGYVFQLPRISRNPTGLRILDVGCGFGEFMEIFSAFGNEMVGTEIHPGLVQRLRAKGFKCFEGELEEIDFKGMKFDVIITRAVLYRTREPWNTINIMKSLLNEDGEIVSVDPCPGLKGASYFFNRQFPQGQFYIIDERKYFDMLEEKFGLIKTDAKLIYGRPTAPLKKVRIWGNIFGILELFFANLFRQKPYMLSYVLKSR